MSAVKQIKVVALEAPTPNQGFEVTAIFDAAGNPIDLADLVARVAALEGPPGGIQ